MKFNILKKLSLVAVLGLLTFSSCKKEDPVHEHDQEEYDKIVVNFIKLNANGNETNDTTAITLDAHGDATPSSITLGSDQSYRVMMNLYSHDESINAEIIADADEHQFFFFANPSTAIATYEYRDGQIGLDGKMTFQGVGNANLNIILRHGLDKTHADALPYNNPNYRNAGGADDLNITFPVHIQ